jgi:hypothetical protein
MNRSTTPVNQRTNTTNPPNIKEEREKRKQEEREEREANRPAFFETNGQNVGMRALTKSMSGMNLSNRKS